MSSVTELVCVTLLGIACLAPALAQETREQAVAGMRKELFNLLNHTNYSTPDNGVQDAQFGQILNAAGLGPEVQFALKLVY